MFDRWLEAQRIGIAAYRLGQTRQPNERLIPILAFLEDKLKNAKAAAESNVANLPPIILQLLCDMLDDNIDSLAASRPYWKDSLDSQLGRARDGGQKQKAIAPALGARILAHHFLHSTSKPLALMRLAHSMFRSNWRTFERKESSLRVLESSLAVLRSPWKTFADRIRAVDSLSATFAGAFNWPHVENALFHQFFAWPLLVPQSKEGCISLPVGVDVFFDDQATPGAAPEVRGGQFVDERLLLTSTTWFDSLSEPGQHVLISERWQSSFRLATRAAKDLWRGKHGNHGTFRERVENASVRFDFTVADKIVAGFPGLFLMSERSMEAYFSQCVLSRFLGAAVSAASIVTGEIGNQRQDEEGNLLYDYHFAWPGDIDKKLSYVFGTRLFERMILPDLNALKEDTRAKMKAFMLEHQDQQSSEINYVKHLQNVSDSCQVSGWRQFRYVRCPEIAWHIHPNGERLPAPESTRVMKVLELLRANTSSVLELASQEYRPIDLAGALWHINVALREQIPLAWRPPMMSWAYLRAVRDEQDERFWHVLWKLAGASRESYDEFHCAATPARAAELIAHCLNCFTPPYSSPSHRAPDIVVVLDADQLSVPSDSAGAMVLGHRPQMFDRIIAKLREPGVLSATFLQQFLGQSRLIVFRGPSRTTPNNRNKTRLDALTDQQRDMLQALSVFRFGFTQQMAALVWSDLDVAGVQVRVELREFKKRGVLRYAVGEYYIPDEMRWPNGEPRPGRQLAYSHYYAGVAFAPYVAKTDIPGLAFDRAFLPENVHEATFHFNEVHDNLPRNDRDPDRAAATDASNRVHRFAEYPGWSVVKRLAEGGQVTKDAFEIALELLDCLKQSGIPVHPQHYRSAIRAAEQHWKAIRLHGKGEADALLEIMRNLFQATTASCSEECWSADGQYCLLGVMAQRSGFLLENEKNLPQPASQEEAAELIASARNLLQAGVDGSAARGQWYEAVGDSIREHRDAEKWYEGGAYWAPDWHQLWFKLCGCRVLNAPESGGAESCLSDLSDERLDAMLKDATPGLLRDKKRGREWVTQRWIEGVSALRKSARCGGYRRVQLQVYERELAQMK